MKRKNDTLQRLWLLLTAVICLAGCGNTARELGQEETLEAEEKRDSIRRLEESRENTALEKKERQSHILIDEGGYRPGDGKTAYFFGEDLSPSFWVVDSADRTRVWEGRLEKLSESASGETVWKGDFTPFEQEGEYFLQTQVIGQSPVFRISEEALDARRDEVLRELEERLPSFALETDEVHFCRNAQTLMDLAECCQLYEAGDEDSKKRLKKAADLLLRAGETLVASEQTGALALSDDCVAMALAADLLAGEEEAQDYKQQALAAYDRLQGQTDEESKDSLLAAQAALYRLTGDRRYAAGVEESLTGFKTYTKENYRAAFCYLTTRKNVNIEICNKLMKALTKECGRITDASRKKTVSAGIEGQKQTEQEDMSEQLFEGRLLRLGDYVLVSREYKQCTAEIIHRLGMAGFFNSDRTNEELAAAYLLMAEEEK